MREKLEDANEAQSRANKLYTEREVSYKRVFEAITSEQQVLIDLYEPLMTRLSGASGTLAKMTFAVSRTADVIAWAECAETDLVDLRRQGPFRGKGKLSDLAEEALREAWERRCGFCQPCDGVFQGNVSGRSAQTCNRFEGGAS